MRTLHLTHNQLEVLYYHLKETITAEGNTELHNIYQTLLSMRHKE